MAAVKFRLRVMSLIRVLYDGEVESVFLEGDEGEYELLPFHYPLIGALVDSAIKIAHQEPLPIKTGVVMFDNNNCIIIVEEHDMESLLFPGGTPTAGKKND